MVPSSQEWVNIKPQVVSCLQVEPLLGDRDLVHHMVLEVSDSPSERMLLLRNTRGGQLLTLHLLHGWADTPARAGDAVNVLADAQMHEGQWHATCDYQSGGPRRCCAVCMSVGSLLEGAIATAPVRQLCQCNEPTRADLVA